MNELHEQFKHFITKDCPFETIPETNTSPTWMKPELVCEIKFTEKTNDGIFRHPVFMGLRIDKEKEDLENESAIPSQLTGKNPLTKRKTKTAEATTKSEGNKTEHNLVRLTNQNKIYFPGTGITKGDVVNYYQSISKYILPHLKSRPQSLNRFPNGIEGLNFYHKDAGDTAPDWIEKVSVFSESNEKDIQYLICNTADDLAYLNNLGRIDLNPWNSTIDHLNNL